MRKYIFLAVMIVVQLKVGYNQNVSIPINYTLALNKSGDQNDLTVNQELTFYAEVFLTSDNKRKDFTFNKNKFSLAELSNLFAQFRNHIQLNKKVKSYSWEGFAAPVVMGLFKENIDEYLNGVEYQKIGDTHVKLQNTEVVWNDTIAYNQDSSIMLSKNGIYGEKYIVATENDKGELINSEHRVLNPINNIYGIGFTETWNFDAKTGGFYKNVYYTSLKESLFSEYGEYRGTKMRLNFKTQSKPDKKNIIKENINYDVLFDQWNTCDPYSESNNCDITQMIVYSGSANGPFINGAQRGDLLLGVFSAINNHKVIALKPSDFEYNKTENILNNNDLYESLCYTDTAMVTSPYPPYDQSEMIFKSCIEGTNICGIRFIEDWSLEPKQFNFYKKVKYFALLANKYDKNTGLIIGYYPIFYLKPNNK